MPLAMKRFWSDCNKYRTNIGENIKLSVFWASHTSGTLKVHRRALFTLWWPKLANNSESHENSFHTAKNHFAATCTDGSEKSLHAKLSLNFTDNAITTS